MPRIEPGGVKRRPRARPSGVRAAPRLIAQQVGAATVYFRITEESLDVASAPHAVSFDTSSVFEKAAQVVREAVAHLATTLDELEQRLRPRELEIEISFGFDVKGKATIIPVVLTGESTATAGLKVTAKWSAISTDGSVSPKR